MIKIKITKVDAIDWNFIKKEKKKKEAFFYMWLTINTSTNLHRSNGDEQRRIEVLEEEEGRDELFGAPSF